MGSLGEIVDLAKRERGAAILAVLNVTPDSFYDGGRHHTLDQAKRRIDQLLADGADVIDIGAESTRPGAAPVAAREQIERASGPVAYAHSQGALVSVDTTHPEVARAMLDLGARVINDVSCLADSALAQVTAAAQADLILMHSRGTMQDMTGFSVYQEHGYSDVVADVAREWGAARARALEAGLSPERVWFDPGLGFHKSAQHSQELLARLAELHSTAELRRTPARLVIGASRKSFLGVLDDSPPEQRLGASISAALVALLGGAELVRVHDVKETRQALLAFHTLTARAVRGDHA